MSLFFALSLEFFSPPLASSGPRSILQNRRCRPIGQVCTWASLCGPVCSLWLSSTAKACKGGFFSELLVSQKMQSKACLEPVLQEAFSGLPHARSTTRQTPVLGCFAATCFFTQVSSVPSWAEQHHCTSRVFREGGVTSLGPFSLPRGTLGSLVDASVSP